jgi:glycosyltransferase involved in cell wall biosynthesis
MNSDLASASHGSHPLVVWFVNQYAGSPRHGMEFRHYELGRELARLGWSVVVITGSYSHLFAQPPSVTRTYTIEDLEGLTYCWVRLPSYARSFSLGRVLNMIAFMLRLYRLPTNRLPPPDAIVVSSPSLFPILPAERWARRFRSRLIFEVRDIWPLTLQELGGLSRLNPLVAVMSWFERRAYRVADALVSLLPSAGSHFISRGMEPSKLSVISNGASPDALLEPTTPAPSAVHAAASANEFTVGFVGTLGVAAGIEALIGAARLLADEPIGFVIVGHGSEAERFEALASGLPNVTFVGSVPKPDVPATLREFDVCYIGYHASPLWRFGISPNKVYDYMAASRPIILAANMTDDWILGAGCGLTVRPDDEAAIAEAIRSVRALTDAERSRLGANGRAYVEREQTYAALARRYVPILTGAD